MRALARAALAKEHIGIALMAHCGGMEECCSLVSCRKGKHHHQCVVDGHLPMMVCHHQPSLSVVGSTDKPPGLFVPPAVFEDGLALGGMPTGYFLPFVLLLQFLAIDRCLSCADSQRKGNLLRLDRMADERFIVGHQLKVFILATDAESVFCNFVIVHKAC